MAIAVSAFTWSYSLHFS